MYDLGTLKNQNEDWRATDQEGNSIFFNFCHYTDTSACGTNKIDDNFAFMLPKGGECNPITSNTPNAELVEVTERDDLVDPDETQTGIRIMRAGGGECPQDDSRQLLLTIDIWCNPAYA